MIKELFGLIFICGYIFSCWILFYYFCFQTFNKRLYQAFNHLVLNKELSPKKINKTRTKTLHERLFSKSSGS